jgi:plastocyanin
MFSRGTKALLALLVGGIVFAAPALAAVDWTVKVKNSNDTWAPEQHVYLFRGGDGKAVVKWVNPSGASDHNVVSMNTGTDWKMDLTLLRPHNGNSARHTFKKDGDYYFRCTLHSDKIEGNWQGMYGIIHVDS